MVLLVAVVAILVLADIGITAYRLAGNHPVAQAPAAQPRGGPAGSGHPCNHGAYVSAAAHAHQGGGHVSKVARSGLGKNGSCSAPLPGGS